jgi:two-component system response regulator YesN
MISLLLLAQNIGTDVVQEAEDRMIKVFLVEDEIVMREGIKNGIDWEKEGYDFVGEAGDGELAYPLIQKTRPDILLTDIRMPFMDGLELSRLVRKELPDTKIIILSGYDDFQYAKEALRLGVTDYLVKPVAAAKLLEAIHAVAVKIEEEQEQKRYLAEFEKEKLESAAYARQKYFDTLVNGSQPVSEMIEEGRKLGLDLVSNRYNVLLFQVSSGGDQEEYSEAQNTVRAAIMEAAAGDPDVVMIERGADGFVFIIKETEAHTLEEAIDIFSKKLVDTVSAYPGMVYFGGIGRDINRLSEMGLSYQEGGRVFAYRYLRKQNCIVDSRQEVPKTIADIPDDLQLTSIDASKLDRRIVISFLKRGLKSEVPHFINEYFESIGKDNIQSAIFRQYIAMDMYISAVNCMEQLGCDPAEITEHCGDFRKMIGSLSTVSDVKEHLQQLFETVIEIRDNALHKKDSSLFRKAESYIRQNFANEDISLNTVAASVNLSPNHFSTIFSQEEGQTFIEYLTEVRMERARELLRSTSMKTTEVAFAVGYKDPHYFSCLFKKTQECTPREYRLRTEEGLPS